MTFFQRQGSRGTYPGSRDDGWRLYEPDRRDLEELAEFLCGLLADGSLVSLHIRDMLLAYPESFCKFFLSHSYKLPVSVFSSFNVAEINGYQMDDISLYLLLYYSGYLTITGGDEYSLFLSFPNKEIRKAFISGLVSRYTENEFFMDNWTGDFVSACRSGNENTVREKLEMYFSAFSYELVGKEKERFFQSVFHAIFVISGIHAVSEDRGLHGRADEAVIAGDHLWIFELKVDGSAEDALMQVEQRGYADKYSYLMRPGMTVHKVGMNFSSELRNIQEWKISESTIR